MEEDTSNTSNGETPDPNEPSFTNWREGRIGKKNAKEGRSEQPEDSSAPKTSTRHGISGKNPIVNVNSGYQILNSPTEVSYVEETDLFEETTSTPSLDSEDNKVHIRRAIGVEKSLPSFTPIAPGINRFKLDMNRINELDKFHNITPGRTFFNHMLKSQESIRRSFLKDRGPSNTLPRKRKKAKKMLLNDCDENNPFDDMKSITNCIVKNTLNKIEINEDNNNRNDDVIEFNIDPEPMTVSSLGPLAVEHRPNQPIPLSNGEQHLEVVHQTPQIAVLESIVLIVDNGASTNNNTNIEGDSIVTEENQRRRHDVENSNTAELPSVSLPIIRENVDKTTDSNHNGEELQVVEPAMIIVSVGQPATRLNEEGTVSPSSADEQEEAESVARASREALFDPNSESDLLEEFDVPPQSNEPPAPERTAAVVLIGVSPNVEGNPLDINTFPRWLLQILGAHVDGSNEEVAERLRAEEPHFYCQGDGLGIHPSVIAVEVAEDEDSTESSNTGEYADVEQEPSSQDASSLPEESQPDPESPNYSTEPHPTTSQETGEYFDTESENQCN